MILEGNLVCKQPSNAFYWAWFMGKMENLMVENPSKHLGSSSTMGRWKWNRDVSDSQQWKTFSVSIGCTEVNWYFPYNESRSWTHGSPFFFFFLFSFSFRMVKENFIKSRNSNKMSGSWCPKIGTMAFLILFFVQIWHTGGTNVRTFTPFSRLVFRG